MTELEAFVRSRLDEEQRLAEAANSSVWGTDCWFDTSNEHISDHYLAHGPDRVLADVAFKQHLLQLFAMSSEGFGDSKGWVLIRDAVYQLAALWSDHEDYNPDWRTKSTTDDTLKFATGGLVQGPGRPIIGGGVDCVFPIDAAMVRAANPSPAINPPAIADAINSNDFESFPPKDPAVKEFEAELRRAVKRSDLDE